MIAERASERLAPMPEISRFYGIVISMYAGDHPPPHFHASYAGAEVKVDIRTGRVLEGRLGPRASRLIREWAMLRQFELMRAWEQAVEMRAVDRIPPLE